MPGTVREASPNIPQLQDVGDVPGREDPSDVVEISHVEAAVGAAREGHGGQELVAVGEAVAAGTGNAPAAPVAHDAPNDRWLLRHKLVLPVSLVQDAWDEGRGAESLMGLGAALLWLRGHLGFARNARSLPTASRPSSQGCLSPEGNPGCPG